MRGNTDRFGVPASDKSDLTGFAVGALRQLSNVQLLDRWGVRESVEKLVARATSTGFSTAMTAQRTVRSFTRGGTNVPGQRSALAQSRGVFDLTPTEDEQMLVEVATQFADEVLRPDAAARNETCDTSEEAIAGAHEIGLHLLGVPESLGGVSDERASVASVLVLEALARGDMGQAIAVMSSGAVATALSLWGTQEQQQTYLSTLTADDPATASLALSEAAVLFDPALPATQAHTTPEGYVLNGAKALVPRGLDADFFVVGALLDGQARLFVVEASAEGLSVEAEPAMGVRAAGTARLRLDGVEVGEHSLLGSAEDYRECVRLARLAWCALAVGTSQAVLEYVTEYVKTRVAFGEPVAHRQSVAFMVADMALELEGMRLMTYSAAAKVAQGKDASREIALARKLCADKAMRIGLDGVQLLGGHGFVKEHPVERWYRDLRAVAVMEGGVMI